MIVVVVVVVALVIVIIVVQVVTVAEEVGEKLMIILLTCKSNRSNRSVNFPPVAFPTSSFGFNWSNKGPFSDRSTLVEPVGLLLLVLVFFPPMVVIEFKRWLLEGDAS